MNSRDCEPAVRPDELPVPGATLANTYGQDIEYRLSSLLLTKLFKDPIVVDVGVERGSFMQLALHSGAAKVVGFEPLPRHLAWLSELFSGEPRASVLPLAISSRSGRAVLHIATDADGKELDYHHSLDELGDSASIVRSRKSLDVKTATLAELVADGKLPQEINFLKIDTDGHDLAVLEGLGGIRPGIIMAEYWDNLPETSGVSPYHLADLAKWANASGYRKLLVIRRNGRLELLEQDAAYSIAGDWGNVFMLRFDLDYSIVSDDVNAYAQALHESTLEYLRGLTADVEAKESEIRRLDNALRTQKQLQSPNDSHRRMAEFEAKEAVIQELKTAYGNAQANIEQFGAIFSQQANEVSASRQLLGASEARVEAKEAVIRELKTAYDGAQERLDRLVAQVERRGIELATARQALATSQTSHEAIAAQLGERDGLIQVLSDSLKSAGVSGSSQVNVALMKSLEEKENVIQELAGALNAYRAAYSLWGNFRRPAVRVRTAFYAAGERFRAIVKPRLGNLNQYPPQPMRFPRRYERTITLSETPKVSIITPSFRQADYIGRTIDSVLDQNYPNLEYFVQDGGSKDGTVDVLKRYGKRLAGWESRPDEGQSQAINLGFARTTGEIMAWLNSDDILLPGALHTVVEYFNRHPDVDVLYGNRVLVDENDQQIGRWIIPGHNSEILSWADYVPQETMFWRRRLWEKVGGRVDESFRFAMDWDLLVRMRDVGARFAHIPRFLGAFRIHAHQKTSASINEIGHREMDRIRERVLGRVPDHSEIRKALRPFLLKHVCVDIGHRIKARLGGR